MKWTDDYRLGHAAMDETHEEFVACVSAVLVGTDTELKDLLDALAIHLERHFGQEDEWMRASEFPPRDCHIDEHASVMRSVRDVQRLLAHPPEGVNPFAITRSLAAALADWFEGHAAHLDSALSHWICKRSTGGKPVVLKLRRKHALAS